MSGFEGRDAIAGYLASKGLPMTGENVRRALEQNAANPGLIKGLTNQAPPPPDSSSNGGGTSSNQRGSAAAGLSQRMHQSAPQATLSQPQQPQAMSDSAASQPPPASGGGGNVLQSLAQMILGGGAGAGLAHLFMGSGGSPQPMPQYNIPMPGSDPQIGAPMAHLPAPQAALPPPPSMPPPTSPPPPPPGPQVPPTQPSPPSTPSPEMPTEGMWPHNSSGTTIDINPKTAGVNSNINWEKVLGDIGHVVRR